LLKGVSVFQSETFFAHDRDFRVWMIAGDGLKFIAIWAISDKSWSIINIRENIRALMPNF
jgi:hypothetical protein